MPNKNLEMKLLEYELEEAKNWVDISQDTSWARAWVSRLEKEIDLYKTQNFGFKLDIIRRNKMPYRPPKKYRSKTWFWWMWSCIRRGYRSIFENNR